MFLNAIYAMLDSVARRNFSLSLSFVIAPFICNYFELPHFYNNSLEEKSNFIVENFFVFDSNVSALRTHVRFSECVNNAKTFVDDVFGGCLASTIICSQCNTVSILIALLLICYPQWLPKELE